jgi:hypothetical protein
MTKFGNSYLEKKQEISPTKKVDRMPSPFDKISSKE